MAAKKGPAMRRTGAPVEALLARVPDEQQRESGLLESAADRDGDVLGLEVLLDP